jgi:transcriptional regulator with XRE-family HTH domain
MNQLKSPQELEFLLGESLKRLRLQKNLDQKTLSERAGVSLTALKHLESGRATLKTLVRVVRALDRQDWLGSLAPQISVNPLHMLKTAAPRQRARKRAKSS